MSLRVPVGLVFSDRYLQHNTNPYRLPGSKQPLPFVEPVDHPSNPRLVERSKKLIDLTGLGEQLTPIAPYAATVEQLQTYHTAEYVKHVKELSAQGGGDAGTNAPVGVDSYEISLLAAGGVMAAIDGVMDGTVRRSYALVRPPGHHAMASRGMGFCIFSNVAVAVNVARQQYGLKRVMILDWDVHHGNGTEDAFIEDPDVLFFSIHQDGLFPAEYGPVHNVGCGDGRGYTVNIPLPAGSGNAAYSSLFDRVVEPIANTFEPELVIICAGQDASSQDPLGRMTVTTAGYREMTRRMIAIAENHASGRLVAAQEGGYSEWYAPYCTLAIIEEMAEIQSGIEEPINPERAAQWPTSQSVSGDQQAAIDVAVQHQRKYWSL